MRVELLEYELEIKEISKDELARCADIPIKRLNGLFELKKEFTLEEILKVCRVLNLNSNQIKAIFFTQ